MDEIIVRGKPKIFTFVQFYNADLKPFEGPYLLGIGDEKLINPLLIKREAVAWKVFQEIRVEIGFGKMSFVSRTTKIFESGFVFNGGSFIDRELFEKKVLMSPAMKECLYCEMKEKETEIIIRTCAGTYHPFCNGDTFSYLQK